MFDGGKIFSFASTKYPLPPPSPFSQLMAYELMNVVAGIGDGDESHIIA
jgi:hypothetical protein